MLRSGESAGRHNERKQTSGYAKKKGGVFNGMSGCFYLPLSAARDVADVVQRADLGLNFELQLLIFDLNVSTT